MRVRNVGIDRKRTRGAKTAGIFSIEGLKCMQGQKVGIYQVLNRIHHAHDRRLNAFPRLLEDVRAETRMGLTLLDMQVGYLF